MGEAKGRDEGRIEDAREDLVAPGQQEAGAARAKVEAEIACRPISIACTI